jgi:hypothetical protein
VRGEEAEGLIFRMMKKKGRFGGVMTYVDWNEVVFFGRLLFR